MKQFTGFLKTLLFAAAMLCNFYTQAQTTYTHSYTNPEWTKDYEPFRIAGNLYYVGTYDLACYLITTPKGHILINTGLEDSAPLLRAHVEMLGFNFSDIKILLATHAHFDHVGAMAEVKKITGASMMIDAKDAPVLADGGNSDFIFGGKGASFAPVKADRLLHDKDTVKLDQMKIVVLHHPGHTKGACSFLFDVSDEQRSYRVLIANMPSVLDEAKLPAMTSYPAIGKDYAYTFASLKAQRFDLWLSSHASQFGLHQKRREGDAYSPAQFADRPGYDAEVAELEKKYQEKLQAK